jgi:hypothetical protein
MESPNRTIESIIGAKDMREPSINVHSNHSERSARHSTPELNPIYNYSPYKVSKTEDWGAYQAPGRILLLLNKPFLTLTPCTSLVPVHVLFGVLYTRDAHQIRLEYVEMFTHCLHFNLEFRLPLRNSLSAQRQWILSPAT